MRLFWGFFPRIDLSKYLFSWHSKTGP